MVAVKSGSLFWTPTPEQIESAHVTRFRKYVNQKYHLSLKDVWDLHRFSITRSNDFWTSVWEFCGVLGDLDPDKPLFDESRQLPDTKHTLNARICWAENQLLSSKNARSKTQTAVVGTIEKTPQVPDGFIRSLTYEGLYQEVRKAANGLVKLGVKPGDRVAAVTCNNVEAIVFTLATNTVGAIWSSTSPDFGVNAVLERFEQIEPTVLLVVDAYQYAGKTINVLPKLETIVNALSRKGLKHVIVVGQLHKDREPRSLQSFKTPPLVSKTGWNAFLASGDYGSRDIQFVRRDAMTPLWILYSSGTTGKPKSIVHGQGGHVLAQAAVCVLHHNQSPSEVKLQFTTCSWMMWNYAISIFQIGMTCIAYDGSPLQPSSVLWEQIQRYGVHYLGVSPRYLQVLLSRDYAPKDHFALDTLKAIHLAGAPVKPELYEYMREKVKRDVFVNNASGGTDICNIFVGASYTLPVHCGEMAMPSLGADVQCWSESGEQITDGTQGVMVCVNLIPNMPLGFWGEKDDKRYYDSYFDSFPHKKTVWNHADLIVVNPKTRGIDIQGRADAVLNPGGVRFGSAELYAVVEEMKDIVEDCIAVGQKWKGDERVILFVKTPGNVPMPTSTPQQLREAIKKALSARHVPEIILQAPDLPYTVNMKRCEVAVKKVVNGTPIDKVSRSAMENPKSLDWFVNRPELQRDAKL